MYSIGKFSKMTRISLRTLEIYDDFELLKPISQIGNPQFRYYSEEQLEEAYEISRLSRCGFTVPEIKSILCANEEYYKYILEEKLEVLLKEDVPDKSIIHELRRLISRNPSDEDNLNFEYDVLFGGIREKTLLVLKTVASPDETHEVIKSLYEFAEENGLCALNKPSVSFLGDDTDERDVTLFMIPLKIDTPEGVDLDDIGRYPSEINFDEKTIINMPAYDVLSTIHIGSIKDLSTAYQSVVKYASEEGIGITGACYETYLLHDGSDIDDENFVTQVFFEIE